MAQLVKAAQAGFDEKNDALVTVEPIASGIEIELTSKVIRQYGDQIKSVVLNTVKEAGFDGVKVIVQDKNAWDYMVTIKASSGLPMRYRTIRKTSRKITWERIGLRRRCTRTDDRPLAGSCKTGYQM